METADTKERILEASQALVQVRGFNAFSYRDLAESVGIRTASIHYYFPRKDDLALSLVRRYHEGFRQILRQIESREVRSEGRLASYLNLFSSLSEDGLRLCLFGVFSADAASLSEEVLMEIRAFCDTNVDWVSKVLKAGQKEGAFSFSGSPLELARGIFALMEGELLVRRALRAPGPPPGIPPVVRALLSCRGAGPFAATDHIT